MIPFEYTRRQHNHSRNYAESRRQSYHKPRVSAAGRHADVPYGAKYDSQPCGIPLGASHRAGKSQCIDRRIKKSLSCFGFAHLPPLCRITLGSPYKQYCQPSRYLHMDELCTKPPQLFGNRIFRVYGPQSFACRTLPTKHPLCGVPYQFVLTGGVNPPSALRRTRVAEVLSAFELVVYERNPRSPLALTLGELSPQVTERVTLCPATRRSQW